MRRGIILFAVLMARPGLAAQDAPDKNKGDATDSYVIPDAPAMTLLNSDVTTIDRPGSPAQLGVALVNLVTPEGTVRGGIAMEISARGMHLAKWSHYQYVTDWWRQFVTRSAISIATVSDSATMMTPGVTRLAFGARFVFFDDSDPLLETTYQEFVNAARTQCADKPPEQQPDCEQAAFNALQEKWPKPKWNAGGLSLALADSIVFADSKVGKGTSDMFASWLVAAHGFGNWTQLSLGARYDHSWQSGDDIASIATRIRIGVESIRFLSEGSISFDHTMASTDTSGKISVGTEVRLSSSVWLTASVGGDIHSTSDLSSIFALGNIKWGWIDKPSF